MNKCDIWKDEKQLMVSVNVKNYRQQTIMVKFQIGKQNYTVNWKQRLKCQSVHFTSVA